MKNFIFLFLISMPLVSLSQETWNKTYLNSLIDHEEQNFAYAIPTGLFLEENHIMVFTEAAWCGNCESIARLQYLKIDYSGNVLDTIRFPEYDDNNRYWINGTFNYKGMFENEEGYKVGTFLHYPDTGVFFENYHHTMYHFDQDFNAVAVDTLWGLSNEAHDLSYIVNGLQYDSESYLLSGYVYDSLTITIPDDGIDTEQALMAKVNKENGENIWKRYYPQYRRFNSLHMDSNGFLWVVASKFTSYIEEYNADNLDFILLKINGDGDIIKASEPFGGASIEGGRPVPVIIEENRILLGGIMSNDEIEPEGLGTGTYFTMIFEETEDGFEEIQLKRYGASEYFHQKVSGFYPVETEGASGYFLYGTYRQTEDPWQRGLLLNLDENLDTNWTRTYTHYNNPSSEHFFRYFEPAPDGGYIGCGYVENAPGDPYPGLQQLWLFRTDEYGCIEPGCQDVNVDEIIVGLENVMSVYPNPASEQVTIEFDFPAGYSPPNKGEFRLMSTEGKEVLRKEVNASSFGSPLQLDISTLKSGVYILHWTDGKKWMDSVRIVVN